VKFNSEGFNGMKRLKVLIACEYSGATRDAFKDAGHYAVSCDLLPTDVPGFHHRCDVFDVISEGWDLMIAHPPCTYLCSSGLHWNKRPEGIAINREGKTLEALDFVRRLMTVDIPYIAIENPIGRIGTAIRKADQFIQPHEFGHNASKRTGLWLKGLPKLTPTAYIEPRIVQGKKRWANQTDSGQNALPPSKDRWKIRSTTYGGWSKAMADQWGEFISNQIV
jgi:hypothetical protein